MAEAPGTRERVEAQLLVFGAVEPCDPFTGQPEVLLFVANTAQEVVALLDLFKRMPPRAVLLDLQERISTAVAALHGFRGYLIPEELPPGHRSCLEQVARGYSHAPEPFSGRFHYEWERGPLSEHDREILRLAAHGLNHEEMAGELSISERTLDRHVHSLRARLGLKRGTALAVFAATGMGYGASSA